MLLAELFESPPVPLGVFLREHCQFVTQDTPGTSTVQETDPIAGDIEHAPGLSDILERAFVARSLGGRWPPPKAEPGASQAGQGELVNRAIERILRSGTPNVLAFGYRQIGDKSTHCLPGTRSVENYFPNTLVNQVKSPAWEELLGRIGDPLMTYILTSLYIFLPLSNGCWFQLAGAPASELVHPGMISRDSFGMNHTPIPQVQLATTTTTGNQPPPPPKRGSKKRKRGGLPGLKTRDTTSGKTPSDPFEPEHGKKKRRVGTHPITTAANALPAPSTTAVSEVLMVSPSQVAAASKKRKRHTPKRKKVQTGDGCTSEDVSRNPTLPSPSESSVRDPAGIEDIVHGRQAAILPMGDGVVEVAAVTSATDAALQGQNRNPSNASESGMDLDEFGDCDEFDMDLDWDLPVLPPNLASHPEGNTMASDMGTPTTRIVEPPGEPRVGDGNKPGVTVKGFFEKPTQLVFSRSRIFYARPARGRKGTILVGLPKHHVLSRVRPTHSASHIAWSVLASIFPFTTRFALPPSRRAILADPRARFGHLTQRTVAAMARCQVPKRLKIFMGLVRRVVTGANRINWTALMRFHCPREDTDVVVGEGEKAASTSSSQPPVNLLRSVVQYRRVAAYVEAIVDRVFPKFVWGSTANRTVIQRFIARVVQLRRFETLTLQDLLDGFSVKAVKWLAPRREQKHVPLTDFVKRSKLLAEFLWWFGEHFVLPLIRTSFHVTESAPMKNRVFYFRHDVWQELSEPLLAALGSSNFEEVSLAEAGDVILSRQFGFSFVRMLPKEAGARPIMNLKRKFTREEIMSALLPKKPSQRAALYPGGLPAAKQLPGVSSVNGSMSNAFQALTLEKSLNPTLFGASVLGMNEIYTRLKSFRETLRLGMVDGGSASNGTSDRLPKLFFAKVDVKAAFDTLTHDKLLEILDNMMTLDEYVVHKYSMIHPAAGRIKKTYVRKAGDAGDFVQFQEFAAGLARTLRNTIFIDQVVYPYELREELIRTVEEHIRNNIVKIGKKFYRQTVGIPQGSVLSSLLCSFFYGDMERTVLAFTVGNDGILLRLIDDFLYISLSKEKASQFLKIMYQGHPKYGCFINKTKTLVNFDLEVEGKMLPHVRDWNPTGTKEHCSPLEFPWCGILINTKTLAVKADYTRYANSYVRENLSMDTYRKPGQNLQYKLLQSLKPKFHPLFLDASLNSTSIILLNIYQNLRLSAIKMLAFLKEMSNFNQVFILRTIRSTIRYACAIIKNRINCVIARENGCECQITKLQVEWLGCRAFCDVLTLKRSKCFGILRALKANLEEKRFLQLGKRMDLIIEESKSAVLRSILF